MAEPESVKQVDKEKLAQTVQFKCPQCGGKVEYHPGTRAQKCLYCGHISEFSKGSEKIEELDYESFADNKDVSVEIKIDVCKSCGAQIKVSSGIVSHACPFCGSGLITQGGSIKEIQPKSLLPFGIPQNDALESYKGWLSRLWLAPSGLKKNAMLDAPLAGMYLPYWTYDCKTHTKYTGQRGDDYVVHMRNRTETRTRWTNATGEVDENFDDILVLASTSLPRRLTEKLEPWDLETLEPYCNEFLSGFRAETYEINLAQGFTLAAERMVDPIKQDIREDIGGDHQRILSMDTRYENITFKHILLPIWVAAYRYNDKPYRFLINGRTGEVQGERPWSLWKIAAIVGTVAALIAWGILSSG